MALHQSNESTAHRHMVLRLPLGLLLLLAAPFASSLEIEGSIAHDTEYTNNTARSENDEVDEFIHSPGFGVSAAQDTASLQLDAGYRYRRQIHSEDLFNDEDITTGNAALLWTIIEDRLNFVARNTRSQSTRRAQGVANPDNLQVVSNTELGPTLRLQPRPGDELQIEYRYRVDSRDRTNQDSQRHDGTLRYVIGLSPSRSIVLQSTYSDISYDDIDDATQLTATVGYQQSTEDIQFNATVGYSEFDRDGRDTAGGGVYTSSLSWRASGATSFSVVGNRSVQDQSTRFRNRQDFDDPIQEQSDTNEVFTETSIRFSIQQALGPRTNANLSVYGSDEEFEDVGARDSTRYGFRVGIDRRLTRSIDLDARFDFANREFELGDDEQDEIRAGVNLSYQAGRALTLRLGATYEDRDADTAQSFDEWRYRVGFSYAVLPRR